jgi:hypothetical protein
MILNIFFVVDVDSSKLDLSKELANEFSNAFDGLIDPNDLQLTTDDFVNTKKSKTNYPLFCFSCSMRLIFPLIQIYVMIHFAWKIRNITISV